MYNPTCNEVPRANCNEVPRAVFTSNKRHDMMGKVYFNHRYLFNQRHIVKPPKNINAGVLVLLLKDYFPGLVFIPKVSGDLAISNYITEKNGKWSLDIAAMARSTEKSFSCLFPEKAIHWDEAKARSRYGCADVIRFLLDAENEFFVIEFNKLNKAGLAKINRESVPGDFLQELNYYGKPVWEEWDFSGFILHKMRHNPPNIYEAFDYYGHKHYTLYGFGLDAVSQSGKTEMVYTEKDLLNRGYDLLNDAVKDNIPNFDYLNTKHGAAFFELIHETLESVPIGKSVYTPTELNLFIKQLKSRLTGFYKKSSNEYDTDTYTPSDRKTINNHLDKVMTYVKDGESLSELHRLRVSGTYREKINLLHRLISDQSIGDNYNPRELAIIHGLFLKQFNQVSIDKLLSDDDGEETLTGHDIISDEKYLNSEDNLSWSSLFRTEFEKELDEGRLDKFLECLPGHFEQYPFDIDSGGDLKISKYSKKILFSTFCSAAGIAEDSELWKPFLVLIQKVVGNINKARNDLRG